MLHLPDINIKSCKSDDNISYSTLCVKILKRPPTGGKAFCSHLWFSGITGLSHKAAEMLLACESTTMSAIKAHIDDM